MTDDRRTVNSDSRLEEAVSEIRRLYAEHHYLEVEITVGERQRTMTQNQALHLWFKFLAKTLNDAGLDMRTVIREDVNIPWSKDSVKEYLWRPVQRAMLKKESTTEANRLDYGEVQHTLCEHLYERFGVTCPEWPKREGK